MKRYFRFFRAYDWFYDAIILAVFALVGSADSMGISLFLLFVASLYVFGFLSNSYADRKQDKAAGKSSYIYLFPKAAVISIIALSGILSLALAYALGQIWLGVLIVLLALTYSFPPRWKEQGLMGMVALSITILPLPYLMFAMSESIPWVISLPIIVWLLSMSFTNAIAHHYEDLPADLRSGTRTWATSLGKASARNVYAWSIGLTAVLPFGFFAVFGLADALLHFLICSLLAVQPLNEFFNIT